tara:strand:- start:30886 stop:31728 length:843 start_codon:yes stop_codon:yes gene_type:complete
MQATSSLEESSDNMSYFGTSGPKSNFAYSIGAGYARRANLQAKRGSPGLGATTASRGKNLKVKLTTGQVVAPVTNPINDFYNRTFSKPYPDFGKMKDNYDKANQYYTKEVLEARDSLKSARAGEALQVRMLKDYDAAVLDFNAGEKLIRDGRASEIDTSYSEAVNIMMNLVPSLRNKDITPQAVASGRKELQVQLKMAKDYVAREERHSNTINSKFDSVYMKKLEDHFVDGRLMRESKTALIVSPLMLLAGAGAILYLNRVTFTPPAATGNKSAAFAVFS